MLAFFAIPEFVEPWTEDSRRIPLRAHAVRLPPGADLKPELERLTAELGLLAGCIITCGGSLSRAWLRLAGPLGAPEVFAEFNEPMEIVALSGTLSPDGLHIHIALSRADGSCVAGHVMRGCVVHTTVELVIGELTDVVFRRPVDPATGYGELSVEPRA